MRLLSDIPEGLEREIRRSAERDQRLIAHLQCQLGDAYAARKPAEQCWLEDLRRYEGVPKNPTRNIPIENAPNLEVTLGAIACDTLAAQATDLIWSATPIVTCRAVTTSDTVLMERRTARSKALQTFIAWGVANEWNLREAFDDFVLDDIQLGTGIYCTVWVKRTRKTDLHKVTDQGPRIFCIPLEDFLCPGGTSNVKTAPWFAIRYYLRKGELEERARKADKGGLEWDIAGLQPMGKQDWVRTRREQLGQAQAIQHSDAELYCLHDVHVQFDYDEDGLEEDLFVSGLDLAAGAFGKLSYNPYDTVNVSPARYQKRPHLFPGLGVMRMLAPYQDALSEHTNDALANSRIANTRIFVGKPGISEQLRTMHPLKVIETEVDAFKEVKLADVYPSSYRNTAELMGWAERRVGSEAISGTRPSQVLGGRTPGITALSVMQQANRRFTPAFDAMRLATADAVIQCLYRYREQLKAGNEDAQDNILRVLGAEDGQLVIDLLMEDHFEDEVGVELTASSVSVNKEADRQNALALMGILGQYYDKTLQLLQIGSQQGVSDEVRSAAVKIARATGELVDRTLRTFDTIRDPQTFVLNVEQEIDAIPGLEPDAVQALAQLTQSLAPAEQLALGVPGVGGV